MAVTPKAPLEQPLVKDKLESAMTFKNEAPCRAAGTLGDRGPAHGTARARWFFFPRWITLILGCHISDNNAKINFSIALFH